MTSTEIRSEIDLLQQRIASLQSIERKASTTAAEALEAAAASATLASELATIQSAIGTLESEFQRVLNAENLATHSENVAKLESVADEQWTKLQEAEKLFQQAIQILDEVRKTDLKHQALTIETYGTQNGTSRISGHPWEQTGIPSFTRLNEIEFVMTSTPIRFGYWGQN